MERMNVLVYADSGTTNDSVKQCKLTLRQLLEPYYSVLTVDAETLIKEPWPATSSLLVIPGGADLPYCKKLNGPGNAVIASFVRRGGAYLGFCAGGYYGSSRVEFEVDNPALAVEGPRELQFFPGIARGCAYPGFVYRSELGARACKVSVDTESLPDFLSSDESRGNDNTMFTSYYNGGGIFVDADLSGRESVKVLARYSDPVNVAGGDAAVIWCQHGNGAVILTGIHPEFSPTIMVKTGKDLPSFYPDLVETLKRDSSKRVRFLKAMLKKLGMRVNEQYSEEGIPRITAVHVCGSRPEMVKQLMETFFDDSSKSSSLFEGEADKFMFVKYTSDALEIKQLTVDIISNEADSPEYDPLTCTKPHILYTSDSFRYPTNDETPLFDHATYFKEYNSSNVRRQGIGSIIAYSQVVTSTSTMMEKNLSLMRLLPFGYTNVSSTQIAGRGRGGNHWVSPIGIMSFSTLIRHPINLQSIAPIVFIQYLASMALVEAVRHYGVGCESLDVRLKWPNDIYARNPSYSPEGKLAGNDAPEYLKIGGVLVNSNYFDNQYYLVVGCGMSVNNEAPTTCLNSLVDIQNKIRRKKGLPLLESFRIECLLAKVLKSFDEMYTVFKDQGFKVFESMYYSLWLHENSVVTLDMYGGSKARIKGITLDYGMLIVEELDRNGNETGKRYTLQPDGNSFDMLKGLLKKKD
ncbi:biotin-protein ligase [Dipodascopsis uninucleata]